MRMADGVMYMLTRLASAVYGYNEFGGNVVLELVGL